MGVDKFLIDISPRSVSKNENTDLMNGAGKTGYTVFLPNLLFLNLLFLREVRVLAKLLNFEFAYRNVKKGKLLVSTWCTRAQTMKDGTTGAIRTNL
jgi:hypothetical protein